MLLGQVNRSLRQTVDYGLSPISGQHVGRSDPDGITITELAQHVGTTVSALRYYEQVDILKPDRTRGNARRYGPQMRFRAKLIVRLRRANVPMHCIVAATTSERVRMELLSESTDEGCHEQGAGLLATATLNVCFPAQDECPLVAHLRHHFISSSVTHG